MMFNHTNYIALTKAVTEAVQNGGEQEKYALELLKSAHDHFIEYARTVDAAEMRIRILRFHANDSEEFRDLVTEIDRSRRSSHESCIMFCRILNRKCAACGIGPVFEGDLERREDVTQFVIELVAEVYNFAHEEMKNREEP